MAWGDRCQGIAPQWAFHANTSSALSQQDQVPANLLVNYS
jgi:hypothetical protein